MSYRVEYIDGRSFSMSGNLEDVKEEAWDCIAYKQTAIIYDAEGRAILEKRFITWEEEGIMWYKWLPWRWLV